MVVVNPDDIALCPHALNSLCKPLINSDILLKRRALEEEFGFGRVGDRIMKTRPKDLMTKLIITALKLSIRDPNRQTRMHLLHPSINAHFEFCAISICATAESPDPEFASHAVFDAVDCVLETAVAVGVGCKIVGFGWRVCVGAGEGRVPGWF